MKGFGRLATLLEGLGNRHRYRSLQPAGGVDFASNDYLGLARSEHLRLAAAEALNRGVPLGSGGSRLLRGNHEEHMALELEAATFFDAEAALFMGGGFQANQALFSTLPGADDLVLFDTLVHASAHEGMRLGRAETRPFAHNDVGHAEDILTSWRASGGVGQIWIAVESIYSMEGDRAPLRALAQLAERFDAVLVVDEAHATGIFGPQGRGLAHDLPCESVTLHTCGKGLGVSGGLICGARVLIETLINRARPFVYATAPAPLTAALVRAALGALQEDPSLINGAQGRIRHAHSMARRIGLPTTATPTQIIPVVLGVEAPTMAMATALQAQGFDVRGIRPPTVPRGTSRLRVSITGNVTEPQISALFDAIMTEQANHRISA